MVWQAMKQSLRATGLALMLAPALLAPLSGPVAAQSSEFSPAAHVNGRVITAYELDQRIAMMQAFRQPGDLPTLALQSLIEDALRRQAAKAAGVSVAPDQVQAGMSEFAARAQLPIDQFLAELDKVGVASETLRDFVEAGLLWREAVRAHYGGVTITEAEIDRAIGAGAASGGETRLLLSEIVLPTDKDFDAMALANRIHETATTARAFSVAARDFSQAPTAPNGGQLGWIGVSALPPELAPTLQALKVGEMTVPLPLGQTVQLFFLRDISQAAGDAKAGNQVEYMSFAAPPGMALAPLSAGLDRCDDVYGLARGLPADSVQKVSLAEGAVPAGLRSALARLDPGESAVLPGPGGGEMLVMLCSRAPASAVPPSRDDIRGQLLNSRLNLLATAYLEELRSNAIITLQ